MSWTYECLEDEYKLILTSGRESRTVYTCGTLKDALFLLDVLEVYELVKGGFPSEMVKNKEVKLSKNKKIAKTE